jgi:hypothetical protein
MSDAAIAQMHSNRMKYFDMLKTCKSGINLAYLSGQKLKKTQYTEGTECLEHEKKGCCPAIFFLFLASLRSPGGQSMRRIRPLSCLPLFGTQCPLLD